MPIKEKQRILCQSQLVDYFLPISRCSRIQNVIKIKIAINDKGSPTSSIYVIFPQLKQWRGKTFHNPVPMQVENIQLQHLWFYFDLVARTQKHNTYILVYFLLSNSSGWNPQEPKYLSIAQGYTYCQAPSTPHWNTSVEVRGAKGHCIICICKSHSGFGNICTLFLWWTPLTVVPKKTQVLTEQSDVNVDQGKTVHKCYLSTTRFTIV